MAYLFSRGDGGDANDKEMSKRENEIGKKGKPLGGGLGKGTG